MTSDEARAAVEGLSKDDSRRVLVRGLANDLDWHERERVRILVRIERELTRPTDTTNRPRGTVGEVT
ncbi:MAG: hypothetical protein WD556_09520 [Actinomycetota bacterium]